MAVMSDIDNQRITQYQNAYNAAKASGDKAGMEAAHKGAEAIRASYGYSGGADGSQQVALSNSAVPAAQSLAQSVAPTQYKYADVPATNLYGDYLKQVQNQAQQAQQKYAQMAQAAGTAYANILNGTIAANNAAAAQQIARYNTQKQQAQQAYDANARQAYVAYMQGQQRLPQMLAASGLTGGATETANLNLINGYNTNLGNLNIDRANALRAIDDNILAAKYQAERDNASAYTSNMGNALNSYLGIMGDSLNSDYNYSNLYGNAYSNYVDQDNYIRNYQNQLAQQEEARNQWAQELAYDQSKWAQQMAINEADTAYERQLAAADTAYNQAMTRFQLGMAQPSDLAVLGITEADYNNYLMGLTYGGVSSGGGSSGGSSGGRRSSGRSYSGGSSSGSSGTESGDAIMGSDAWALGIAQAAREAGTTGQNYLAYLYDSEQLKGQENLKRQIAAYDGWQDSNKRALTKPYKNAVKQVKKGLGNTGSTTASIENTIDALYDHGLLNAKQASGLYDKLVKK